MSVIAKNSSDCFRSILSAPAQHKKLFFIAVLLLLFYSVTGKNLKNKNFDYFVFSQRWLPTSCLAYVEHGSSDLLWCAMPKNIESWAVHGLWPTENNHNGPFFCNKSMIFDEGKLHPIESALRLYWPNIEGGLSVTSLWQHEWEKHGTCAAQLQLLDSEFKYFSTTLGLFKKYNVNDLFERYSIKPNSAPAVNVANLFEIIRSSFGKLPQINCIQEVKSRQPYLAEIRLCYNKNLELIDCGKIHSNKFYSGINNLTNCPVTASITYPDSSVLQINKKSFQESSLMNRDNLSTILSILRFLMWVSI